MVFVQLFILNTKAFFESEKPKPMKAIFTLTALCATLTLQAQMATVETEFNNFRWMTALNGAMFFDQANGLPGFEVPVNSGNHAIFAANLWIGGRDDDDQLHVTAERFCQSPGCLFGPGPLRLDGTPESTIPEASSYNRFWTVSKEEVDAHLAYFDCVNDAGCDEQAQYPNGYTPPEDFLTWPAMGDSDEGFAEYLAPFFDYNGDGLYDAESGDHPIFCGDMAVYSIMNDIGHRPEEGQMGPGLGVEVHSMYYAFDSDEPELFNTLFVNKRIINRGEVNYHDAYVAVWNDFDLGNPYDDYIGSDVQRSMIYVYNGTSFDEGSSSGPGYGDDLPMLGMRILRGPLKDANGMDDAPISEDYERYGNQTTGWGDGIADNERLGMAAAIYHSNTGQGAPPPTTDPTIPIEYYNFMRAVWKDGTPLSFGGLGYSPGGPSPWVKYMWPGVSDPLFAGSNFTDPNFPDPAGWTEFTSDNPPGDRRMLASSGPFSLGAGDEQHIDFAYIFARDSHEPGTDVFETLQTYADAVVGMECDPLPQIVLNANDVSPETLGFRLYPNPARHTVTLESLRDGAGHYTIFDLLGKTVAQGNTTGVRNELSVGHLPKGMYLLRYETEGEAAVKKLVVE